MSIRQCGAGGIFVFVVLLLFAVFLIAVMAFNRTSVALEARTQTQTTLDKAGSALEQYAAVSGRLPCPADPAGTDGIASPFAASVNCNFPEGTLPWSTIGMRKDDSFDAWGWKISYRVYSNTAGSMTQANGASMVDCDTVQALTTREAVDLTTRRCLSTHNTVDSDFITGKGLSVTDFGALYDVTKPSGGAAYVLISHGETGLGAYSAAGIRKDLPNSNDEKNNTKATGPFVLEAASDATVASTANNHYDDVLLYRTVADLAKKANLVARDWPDDVLSGVKFDQSTVQNALGSTPSGDLGTTNLSFPYAHITGFNSGGDVDLAFVSGSTAGLGAVGGGTNSLESGEGIRVDLNQKAGQFAFTLSNFGYTNFFGTPIWIEQVELRFYNDGVLLPSPPSPANPLTLQACRAGSVLASYSVKPGALFNRVEIRSMNATTAFTFTPTSSFIVSEFASCTSGALSCKTTLDIANPTSECS